MSKKITDPADIRILTEWFQPLSFLATIAFGIAALLGLLASGLWLGESVVTFLALSALGLSYLAQAFATQVPTHSRFETPALICQLGAVIAYAAGVMQVFLTAFH